MKLNTLKDIITSLDGKSSPVKDAIYKQYELIKLRDLPELYQTLICGIEWQNQNNLYFNKYDNDIDLKGEEAAEYEDQADYISDCDCHGLYLGSDAHRLKEDLDNFNAVYIGEFESDLAYIYLSLDNIENDPTLLLIDPWDHDENDSTFERISGYWLQEKIKLSQFLDKLFIVKQ